MMSAAELVRECSRLRGNVLVELEATMVNTSIGGLSACPELVQNV